MRYAVSPSLPAFPIISPIYQCLLHSSLTVVITYAFIVKDCYRGRLFLRHETRILVDKTRACVFRGSVSEQEGQGSIGEDSLEAANHQARDPMAQILVATPATWNEIGSIVGMLHGLRRYDDKFLTSVGINRRYLSITGSRVVESRKAGSNFSIPEILAWPGFARTQSRFRNGKLHTCATTTHR